MCKENKKLIFCSCSDEGSDKTTSIEGYAWTLNRFIRSKSYENGEARIRGKILSPTKKLSETIHLDVVLEELNSRNCFDFEYVPKEKDCMSIYTTGERYQYFKVLFKDGKWQYGSNPVFDTISESIFEGKIKQSDS